jgi:hypothetical protein
VGERSEVGALEGTKKFTHIQKKSQKVVFFCDSIGYVAPKIIQNYSKFRGEYVSLAAQ